MLVILFTLFGLLLRASMLEQPVSHDEAFTYLHYVKNPFWDAISVYDYPNNHIFYTVCAWITTRVFGLSVISLRLPAFVCGVATVPLVYLLGRRVADKTTGAIAAALSAGCYVLAEQSVDARGYSVQTRCSSRRSCSLRAWSSDPRPRSSLRSRCFARSGSSPYRRCSSEPAVCSSGGSGWCSSNPDAARRIWWRCSPKRMIGAALTLLFYAPAIRFLIHHELPGQFQARQASSSETIGVFATQLFGHFVGRMPAGWLLGVLVAVLLGIVIDLRQRRVPLALLWLSWPVVTVLVHGHMSGRHPFPRNMLFVIPLLFVLAARPIAAALAAFRAEPAVHTTSSWRSPSPQR